MDKINWPDVGERALKTFVQVLLTSLPVAAVMNLDLNGVQAAGLAAGAAALSVVWNAVLQWTRT